MELYPYLSFCFGLNRVSTKGISDFHDVRYLEPGDCETVAEPCDKIWAMKCKGQMAIL